MMMMVLVLSVCLLLLVSSAATPSGDFSSLSNKAGSDPDSDWSQCPSACKCKWASGKRTADCEAGGLQSLPLFPRPDLIQVLIMDHNPLKTLPPRAFHLTGLINVQKVYMKNCSLHDLDPTAMAGLVILIELDLSENYIKDLKQGTFQGNVRLRKLRLASNQLKSLASFTFPTMGHLRLVDLGFNQLTDISYDTFSNLGTNLEVLHLNNNKFLRLSVRPFLSLHTLKSLRIEGNPWQCDCKLRDFWHWLHAKRLLLAFNAATCSAPPKLKGRGLHDLDSEEHLACAPLVWVPQPSVPVTKGGQALLPCRLEDGEAAEVTWLREGVAVKANLTQSAVIYGQYYVIYTGQRWYNLSIENIEPPTSSDLYTCVASNEGGISQANVTLVHSPNVATYVGDGEAVISWLLTGGVASGVLLFLLLSLWLLFCSVQKARRSQNRSSGGCVNVPPKSSDTTGGLSSSNLIASNDDSKVASRTASMEAMDASTFEEQQLRQTTAVARAQRQAAVAAKNGGGQNSTAPAIEATMKNMVATSDWERPYPDLLDCHQNNYIEMSSDHHQQQPPPPPFQPQLQPPWNRPLMASMSSNGGGGHLLPPRLFTPPPQTMPNTAGNYGTSRGYINSLSAVGSQGPLPLRMSNNGGGQLSDPDSGCFSSSGNEAWFDHHGQQHSQLQLIMDSSSPLSSSGSSMMSHPPTNSASSSAAAAAATQMIPNNNRLLAHTLENRKRVLQTLIREKADTLV